MKTIFAYIFAIISVITSGGCGLFTNHGDKLTFGAGELFYKDGVSKDEAEKLGNYLVEEGFFDDETPKSVQIVKKNDAYVFKMVTKDEYFKDDNFSRTVGFVAMDLSADVFEQARVDVELTDDSFVTQKEIPSPGVRVDRNKALVYRTYNVDEEMAKKVTDYLVEIEFIGAKPMTIAYDIEGDDFLYELVTEENAEKDLKTVNANKTICGLISLKVLDNKPIRMNFLDTDYSIKATYPFEEIQASYLNFMSSIDSMVIE